MAIAIPAGSPVHIITAVSIVDVESGSVIRDQNVLIGEGRIAAAGPRKGVTAPRGAVRIDGRGRSLVLGFADMHVHPYTVGDA